MLTEEKFAAERSKVMKAANQGIDSNIPLAAVQKKYLKNLLLYAMMSATANETVSNRNFIKLVNRLFKRYLKQIILKNGDDGDDDDDDVEEGLNVDLNKILADEALLSLEELQAILTPGNIVAQIKANTNGMTQRQILDKLLALRDMKANHRETPEEAREREQRQKEYELQKKRERAMEMANMMERVNVRGDYSR